VFANEFVMVMACRRPRLSAKRAEGEEAERSDADRAGLPRVVSTYFIIFHAREMRSEKHAKDTSKAINLLIKTIRLLDTMRADKMAAIITRIAVSKNRTTSKSPG